MKEIVLDTETTGLSVKEGHRIVEIGCIELDNLIPTKKKFHCYLNPERKVSEKAFEVHGYSDIFLSDVITFLTSLSFFLQTWAGYFLRTTSPSSNLISTIIGITNPPGFSNTIS